MEREDNNSNCWLHNEEWLCYRQRVSSVNQQASMPKCDPKKKSIVGGQNFLGSTKQHNKQCFCLFSKICSPLNEHNKKYATIKGDENRGVHVAKRSSPTK
jgi:hypothetical protein